jgi:hypothetical protein
VAYIATNPTSVQVRGALPLAPGTQWRLPSLDDAVDVARPASASGMLGNAR